MERQPKKEKPLKFNMTFEDALKKALNTPLPKTQPHEKPTKNQKPNSSKGGK